MNGRGALAAGWLLLLVTALTAALGTFLGGFADLRFIGGFVGGITGTIIGFILVWRIYVVPANEEDAGRDYSKVRRFDSDDDDDDSW